MGKSFRENGYDGTRGQVHDRTRAAEEEPRADFLADILTDPTGRDSITEGRGLNRSPRWEDVIDGGSRESGWAR